MFYGGKDNIGRTRKTSRYEKNSASPLFQLGSVVSIVPNSPRKDDKVPRLEPMDFEHFSSKLMAFVCSKDKNGGCWTSFFTRPVTTVYCLECEF
jgi:hypothetical protein